MVAHGVGLVQDGVAEPDLVLGALSLGFEQRDGLGGFGEDVLAVRVDQRDHAAADVEAQGSELGKGSQALVARGHRTEARFAEARLSEANGAVDEALGVEPWAVVSVQRRPSLAFTVTARRATLRARAGQETHLWRSRSRAASGQGSTGMFARVCGLHPDIIWPTHAGGERPASGIEVQRRCRVVRGGTERSLDTHCPQSCFVFLISAEQTSGTQGDSSGTLYLRSAFDSVGTARRTIPSWTGGPRLALASA